MALLRAFLRPTMVPKEYRGNFTHLYFDIAWFGVLSGTAINFLNVYAARLGASGFQIGLLGAVPALVSLVLSIPAGNWLVKQPVGKATFWTAVLYRLGYLLWIPLPWLFNNQGQIWALVAITLLMGIPLTALGLGFNSLFASAVPSEWRAYVVGIRNVLQAVTFMVSSLGAGYLLDHLPFPIGYQVVFAIGFLGAAMSTLHLFFIRTKPAPGSTPRMADPEPAAHSSAIPTHRGWKSALRLDIWQTPFKRTLLVLLGFHLGQYLALPIFPLYNVNVLHLNDSAIGIGTALFYLTVLLGSTQLNRLVRLAGHHKITGWGVVGMSLYPILLSLTHTVGQYYFISTLGGFTWALVGGAYANYLLERIPETDRPAHLAWYSIVANASILTASLVGPLVANLTGLAAALVIFGILRLLAGVSILKWG